MLGADAIRRDSSPEADRRGLNGNALFAIEHRPGIYTIVTNRRIKEPDARIPIPFIR
jgi:hypothetical protein